MRKLLVALFMVAGLGLITAPACVVRTHPTHRHGHVRHKPKRHHHHKRHKRHHRKHHRHCAPSHYWDGHKCRHKGRGKGARKHDY